MRSIILITAFGAACLAPSVFSQRLPVDHAVEPIPVDGATNAGEGDYLPDQAMVEEVVSPSPSQIAVNGSDTITQPPPPPPAPAQPVQPQEPPEPVVPISALFYASSPGPKSCRGHVLMNVALPKPGSQHTTPTCYNVPGRGTAQCATFVGNKDDGCEARLFNDPDCLNFANVAVFTPELKPMGGLVRSVEITCGIEGVAPAPLNLPGMNLEGEAQQAFG